MFRSPPGIIIRESYESINYTNKTNNLSTYVLILYIVHMYLYCILYICTYIVSFVCVIYTLTRAPDEDPRTGSKYVALTYRDCNI
jgi:hypothetical protein